MVHRSCLRFCSCCDLCRAVVTELPRISTQPEARELQPNPSDGSHNQRRDCRQQLSQAEVFGSSSKWGSKRAIAIYRELTCIRTSLPFSIAPRGSLGPLP